MDVLPIVNKSYCVFVKSGRADVILFLILVDYICFVILSSLFIRILPTAVTRVTLKQHYSCMSHESIRSILDNLIHLSTIGLT